MKKFNFTAFNHVSNTNEIATITANLRKNRLDVRVKDIQKVAREGDQVIQKEFINSYISDREFEGMIVQGVSGDCVFQIEKRGGDWLLKKVERKKINDSGEPLVFIYTLAQKIQRRRLKRQFFSVFYADRQQAAA